MAQGATPTGPQRGASSGNTNHSNPPRRRRRAAGATYRYSRGPRSLRPRVAAPPCGRRPHVPSPHSLSPVRAPACPPDGSRVKGFTWNPGTGAAAGVQASSPTPGSRSGPIPSNHQPGRGPFLEWDTPCRSRGATAPTAARSPRRPAHRDHRIRGGRAEEGVVRKDINNATAVAPSEDDAPRAMSSAGRDQPLSATDPLLGHWELMGPSYQDARPGRCSWAANGST